MVLYLNPLKLQEFLNSDNITLETELHKLPGTVNNVPLLPVEVMEENDRIEECY